jgi:phosphoribosylformimino-5-aminoimidazole carboxamide ribotide isomerase
MLIFPAIDLSGGNAVRLYKGDYARMTVYSHEPAEVALDFKKAGATHMHVVDLDGAKSGETPNFDAVLKLREATDLFIELGGGIRSEAVVDRYLGAGIDRVILGTAAVKDKAFLRSAVEKHGDRIAVGVDLLDGFVAIKGWTERTGLRAEEFFDELKALGVRTVICTDISRDGAMRGTNRELYKELSKLDAIDVIASGGVSDLDDVRALRDAGICGAIIGKAYYTGAIDLAEAIREGLGGNGRGTELPVERVAGNGCGTELPVERVAVNGCGTELPVERLAGNGRGTELPADHRAAGNGRVTGLPANDPTASPRRPERPAGCPADYRAASAAPGPDAPPSTAPASPEKEAAK